MIVGPALDASSGDKLVERVSKALRPAQSIESTMELAAKCKE
jgi:hypothetical protein